ncbi:MAG: LamG domain-containing protein [Deltaproteobacteria bacterium]|nr:LamG domain-containing protein [Deltaproteobacteria bacterium]
MRKGRLTIRTRNTLSTTLLTTCSFATVLGAGHALGQTGPGAMLKPFNWNRSPKISCSGLVGGTWVDVPGDNIYGTTDFCIQKYAASNVGGAPTAQPGTVPWVNISQTTAASTCSSLGNGYHLLTNPEFMTIAASIARTPSNWSGGAIGSGTLVQGNIGGVTSAGCAADANDANAYVNSSCTASNAGTFANRRTQFLSTGRVIWDFVGNIMHNINYTNLSDKPGATNSWYEFTDPALATGTATLPRTQLVPVSSTQSWWNDNWNSTQRVGQFFPAPNGSGGAMYRGAAFPSGSLTSGLFTAAMDNTPTLAGTHYGIRCAWTPGECTGLAGGNWVKVPGDPDFGTSEFCVQKYPASNVSGIATAQAGQAPWVNVSFTAAKAACAALGTEYHLITNPEWMTIATNIARTPSNWSGGVVGNGTLSRGNSGSVTTAACAASANDTNAYVDSNCVGQNTGTFSLRRTQNLASGNVIWDVGGNLWQWVDYVNTSDKPGAGTTVQELTAFAGTISTPINNLLPVSPYQSWWTNTWNSNKNAGQYYAGTNGTGGYMCRGGRFDTGVMAGPFATALDSLASRTWDGIGFRCVHSPTGPQSISSLRLWLKAETLTGTADGTAIWTWKDQSGNGFDLSQSTAANRPTFKMGQINGRPAVRFNGSTNYMQVAFTGSITSKTMFVVAKLGTLTPSGAAYGGAAVTVQSADGYTFDAIVYNEYTVKRWMNGSDGFTRTPSMVSPTDETSIGPHIVTIRSTTSDYALYRNGQLLQSTTTYSPPTITNGTFNLSARHIINGTPVSNGYFNGDIAEVIVYDRALTEVERQRVEAYLRTKYGL